MVRTFSFEGRHFAIDLEKNQLVVDGRRRFGLLELEYYNTFDMTQPPR